MLKKQKYYTYSTNTRARLIKRIKHFNLKRKTNGCISKITRMQQGTAFSTVLYKIDLLRSNNQLSCRGKIEIKCLFSWLLQCNLLGVEKKASANAFGFSISNNISPPQRIIAIYTKTRVLILKPSVIS